MASASDEAQELEAQDPEAQDSEAQDSEAEDLGDLLDRLVAQTDPRTPSAPRDPVPPSSFSRRLAGVVIAALAAHGLLLAVLDRLERAPAQAKPFQEIAVDLITSEAPKPGKEEKPKDEKAQEQKIQEQKIQEQKAQEARPPEQRAPEEKAKEEAVKPEPVKAPEAKAEETKPSEAKPQAAPPPAPPKEAAKQEAPKQETPKQETAAQEPKREPPKAEPPQPEPVKQEPPRQEPARQQATRPVAKAAAKGAGRKSAARSASPPKTEAAKPELPRPEIASAPAAPQEAQDPAHLAALRQPGAGAPPPQEPAASALEGTRSIPSGYNFLPDNFRVLAVPQSSAEGEDQLPYSTLVFSRLEVSKHYPEAARARGAKGSAGIGFTLDDKGNVLDVELLVPSGDADLDGESVAMVRRAAPFPAPPPGGQRRFDVIVTFDGN